MVMLALFTTLGMCGLLAVTAPAVAFAQGSGPGAAWSAERVPAVLTGQGVTLLPQPISFAGSVRDLATKQGIIAEAHRLFPLAKAEDRMTVDRAGVTLEMAVYALRQLARLESGRVVIAGGELSIVGQSKASDDSVALTSSILGALPPTLRAGPISISPSDIQNYSWSATRNAGKVRFEGYVPSTEAKAQLTADARSRFPEAEVEDNTIVAGGAPEAFVPAARVGLNQLEHADAGLARISGSDLSVFAKVKERNGVSTDALAAALSTTAASAVPENFNSKVAVVPTAPDDDPRSVDFLYATDRVRKDQALTVGFDFNRSPSLTLGVARVHVPEGHGIGKIELPSQGYSILGFTFGKQAADPAKHFIIKSVEILSTDQWKALAAARGDEALVFVHGFNTSFEDAVFRTAQIVWDLQYKGTAVLFSWPSRGDVLSYEWDRNSALVARAHFIELLRLLRNEAGVEKINVIAHSMGNLVVLDALSNDAQTSDPEKIGQLIMAAPDLDLDQYRQSVPNVAKIVGGMTLYASAADKAMLAARTLAQGPRAGDVLDGRPALAEGVDAIDVTAMGDELLGLNHGTFSSNRSVIDDIAKVLQGARPPSARLVQIRGMPEGAVPPLFWRYAP